MKRNKSTTFNKISRRRPATRRTNRHSLIIRQGIRNLLQHLKQIMRFRPMTTRRRRRHPIRRSRNKRKPIGSRLPHNNVMNRIFQLS
ncbi:hypothetical protein Hanom_Chr06g00513591 [Helianthus anomalus]